ncbi:CII family transcriptional regulator [Burkholderia glumae]|uniref:CII family transcriptional regulator n=1 Tax=Burkholderia glumae TaxID=337 RepID=UPI0020371106|nr:CII family transcriptional regulator [Burkholderia glumae]MCM2493289.1 CII family transcriptional regulator [Burkholderia glumae]
MDRIDFDGLQADSGVVLTGGSSHQGGCAANNKQVVMSSETVSSEEVESTRKLGARIESEMLRAIARATQARAAACMGVSASTVSRMLDDLPKWALLMASIGIQAAPIEALVVEKKEIEAAEIFALKYLQLKHPGC